MNVRAGLMKELRRLGLPGAPAASAEVSASDLEPLPEPARRYLTFMGVVGRPRDWSFRVGFRGRFRPSRTKPWLPCEAWQYSSAVEPARIFHMKIRFGGVVPVYGRDVYQHGRGRMVVRVLDLFTVVDAGGDEFDIGELVTYLNDAVLMAPSFLLQPAVRWTAVDDSSFDLSLTDAGRTVSARVLIDERGAPMDFSTTDRFYADGRSKPLRTRWTTPMQGWQVVNGRPLYSHGEAVWHFDEGRLPYADLQPIPESLAFNIAPGD